MFRSERIRQLCTQFEQAPEKSNNVNDGEKELTEVVSKRLPPAPPSEHLPETRVLAPTSPPTSPRDQLAALGIRTKKLDGEAINKIRFARAARMGVAPVEGQRNSGSFRRSLSSGDLRKAMAEEAAAEAMQEEAESMDALEQSKKSKDHPLTRTRSYSSPHHSRDFVEPPNARESVELVAPIVDRKGWCEHGWQQLEKFAENEIEQGTTDSSTAIVKKFIHEAGLTTTTIHQRIKYVKDEATSKLLAPFLKINDPKEFLEAADELDKHQQRILYYVIGGKLVLSCLRLCYSKKVIHEWVKCIDNMKKLSQYTPHIDTKKLSFPPNFDSDLPLCLTSRGEVIATYRSFYTSDELETTPRIFINGKGILTPRMCGLTEKKRQLRYMKYLIGHLNNALGLKAKLDVGQQAKLICTAKIDQEVRDQLDKSLEKLIEENTLDGVVDIQNVMKGIQSSAFPEDFQEWAKKFLKKMINQLWGAEGIVGSYAEYCMINICAKEIPCFRMLQAMSFDGFSKGQKVLQKEYCPELWPEDIKQKVPRMKVFPSDVISFVISTDSKNHTFATTHVKTLRFVTGISQQPDHYGSVEMHWSLTGAAFSPFFSGRLRCEKLKLSARKPIKQTMEIIKKLNFVSGS